MEGEKMRGRREAGTVLLRKGDRGGGKRGRERKGGNGRRKEREGVWEERGRQ